MRIKMENDMCIGIRHRKAHNLTLTLTQKPNPNPNPNPEA